jgi:hypothetical protein
MFEYFVKTVLKYEEFIKVIDFIEQIYNGIQLIIL